MSESRQNFMKLKREFDRAGHNVYQKGCKGCECTPDAMNPRCYFFNQIGELAVDGERDAMKFLIENLQDKDEYVRYAAVGYCHDIITKMFLFINKDIEEKVQDLVCTEKDDLILKKAIHLLRDSKQVKDLLYQLDVERG